MRLDWTQPRGSPAARILARGFGSLGGHFVRLGLQREHLCCCSLCFESGGEVLFPPGLVLWPDVCQLGLCDKLARPGGKALGIVAARGRREQRSVLRCDWLNPIWIQSGIYIFLFLKLGGRIGANVYRGDIELLKCGYGSSKSLQSQLCFPYFLLCVALDCVC